MLPRSSSFTSTDTESVNINTKTTNVRHHESLQNLRQTRPMLSRPLNIENNHLPMIPQNIKRTTTGPILVPTHNLPINSLANDRKHEQQIDTTKRTVVQDDIENIQERLNEMLIIAPIANNNETLLLPAEQVSTTEYFTPKVSIDESGKKKHDEDHSTDDDDDDDLYPMTNGTEPSAHPFFDVLSTTSYEKEVMKYLLSLEARFMEENTKLRSSKRLRESTNSLKPVQGVPIPGSNSTVIITPKVRCKLIDWIISVHDYHRLNAAILCRTIHLIDRILLLNDQMTKLDLQLRAVNCFTIACKLESRRVPDTNSLLSLFDARHHVTPILLNHGEKHLLTQLDFELEYPLAIHFLCYYLRFLPFHFIIYSLSKYMIECVLCDDILSEQMPGSLLAASTLLLALKLTGQSTKAQVLKRFYKHQPYKHDELDKRIEQILKLMQHVPRSLYHTNVREKYKRSEFDRVATYQYNSNLAEIICRVDKLPLEFTNEQWNDIRSDSLTLFGENINITLQTITEQKKSLNGSTVYIRSPLSSEKTTIQLVKATVIDETTNLVKIQDESIANNSPLYFTIPTDQFYYVQEPSKSNFIVNFTYLNPSNSDIFLSYLQTNINWRTQYQLDLNDNQTNLIAMANIRNDGKFPISIDQGELIGGDINLQVVPIQSNAPIRKARFGESFLRVHDDSDSMPMKLAMSISPSVGQGSELVGLYVFPIDKPFTIEGKTNYLLSMYRPQVTMERYGSISKTFSIQSTKGKAQRSYRLCSDRYLSQGSCIIREQNRIVGETILPNLAAKDKYEFSIGEDANIIYKENITLISSVSFNETESSMKISNGNHLSPIVISLRTRYIYEIVVEMKNFKNEPVKIEYEQNGFDSYRSFKMIKANKHRFIQDSLTIKSNMTLKANSEEMYSYTVELIN
ncbi:hypothetical protein I4U23_021492 [Adineta vaga]|nr:hypothetical protein I4U23_021492 [Adineta vaga]